MLRICEGLVSVRECLRPYLRATVDEGACKRKSWSWKSLWSDDAGRSHMRSLCTLTHEQRSRDFLADRTRRTAGVQGLAGTELVR
jgi:hypothetical protein